MKSETVILS